MKHLTLLLAILGLASTPEFVSAQLSKPVLPEGIGVTASLWNTRLQSGSSLSVDMQRFGLELAMHQEFLGDLQMHATRILAGHSNKTEHWLTFARAGALYNWELQLPGLTAETGLSWRLHQRFAFNFTLHGDVTQQGVTAGSRFGIHTNL